MSDLSVDFYWDVGSTNTYFALFLLPDVLARTGARVNFVPFNLGYVFRQLSYALDQEPRAKMRQRRRDLQRWAEYTRLPFRVPEQFPIKTSRALRGAIAMRRWNLEEDYIRATFRAYWEQGVNVADYDALRPIAAELGVDSDAFEKESESEPVKQELIRATSEGLERGVFGAPTFFVGDEMFWGKDRLDFLERELVRQGGSDAKDGGAPTRR